MIAGLRAGPSAGKGAAARAPPPRRGIGKTRAASAAPPPPASPPPPLAFSFSAGKGAARAPSPRRTIAGKARAASAAPPPPPPLAFSFSAGGLLFPYHWGVVAELCERGVLDRATTPIGGASAGSIIVACLRSGLPFDRVTDACLSLAADCRAKGTRTRLGPVLEAMLRDLLPEDVHERCSEGGTAHIAVTRLFPSSSSSSTAAEAAAASPSSPSPLAARLVRSELLSSFDSRDDLIGAVLTSSHIPWYLDGRPTRTFRGGECLDGGLTQFIPAIPGAVVHRNSSSSRSSGSSSSSGSESDGGEVGSVGGPQAATRLVRVTCFPSRAVDAAVHRAARLGALASSSPSSSSSSEAADAALRLERAAAAGGAGAGGGEPPTQRFADLSPDRFGDWGVSMREAIGMALEPAPEATLLALLEKGRDDARRWMAEENVTGGGGGGGGLVVPAGASAAATRGC